MAIKYNPSLMKVRDENGNLIDIPAIKGKSAYEYAVDGGFQGTETEFAEKLAFLMGYSVYGYVDADNNIVIKGNIADGSYIKYEMEDGTTIDIGQLVLDNNVYYSVTSNLTNCTNSNSDTQAIGGESYTATIAADSGYELSSIVVTMGGTDITSSVVTGGNISIANVTGNIVIVAVAEETVVTPSYTNVLPLAIDADGNDFVGTHEKGGDGYEYGYRISTSSGSQTEDSEHACSGFIRLTDLYATVRIKNVTLSDVASRNNIVLYNSAKERVYGAAGTANAFNVKVTVSDGVYSFEAKNWTASEIAFFRFSCAEITDETIVTINEEIV